MGKSSKYDVIIKFISLHLMCDYLTSKKKEYSMILLLILKVSANVPHEPLFDSMIVRRKLMPG